MTFKLVSPEEQKVSHLLKFNLRPIFLDKLIQPTPNVMAREQPAHKPIFTFTLTTTFILRDA
jgi:hypothetical protein